METVIKKRDEEMRNRGEEEDEAKATYKERRKKTRCQRGEMGVL